MTGEFSGSKDRTSLAATFDPTSLLDDHQPIDSDIVRPFAMPDATEDTPTSPPARDSETLRHGDRAIVPPASPPTHSDHEVTLAVHEPTRTSQPARPTAPGATAPGSPDQSAVMCPTRTSLPEPLAHQDPTHTSHPDAALTAASPAQPPQPGVPQLRNPARYHVLGEHGRGGLGKVMRAHDLELGRDVAIKELLSRNAMHEVRFMREALITARLEHPGIVPVHEAGRWPDGTPFYAMKLVAGRPLRELLVERKTVDERIALLHHVIAVADAIAYAHGRNIIHRDLKPGNVIVGDFGETVVIDWGLAKDLSRAEESAARGGALRISRDDDLTSAGAVFGTPAYMAPEQQRGDPVDQRADVYAIGVMLWELCSTDRLLPDNKLQRLKALRSTGIDLDLVTIINKALETDSANRYRDAGALATDLKAFKTGARIAARRYSLLALLIHWTHRNRVHAASIATVLFILTTGSALYMRNIAKERDRAELAKNDANEANIAMAAALAEQTLGHAEVLLTSDPTAALDLLQKYKGSDRFRQEFLKAKAVGSGTAHISISPHTDSVLWMQSLSGEMIGTLSSDGSVATTDSGGTTTIIARSPRVRDIWSFGEERQLLAYLCDDNTICLVDFNRPSSGIIAQFTSPDPEGIAFSPDSRQLAIVSRASDLLIWDLTQVEHPKITQTYPTRGFGVGFLAGGAIVTINGNTAIINTGTSPAREIEARDALATSTSRQGHSFAIATMQGMAILIQEAPFGIVRQQLCDGPLKTIYFTTQSDILAYGCKDGKVGLWYSTDLAQKALTVVQGSANEISSTKDGRYLAIGSSSGVLSVIDLYTGISSTHIGHSGRISSITALDDRQSFATSDLYGNIRIWKIPPPLATILYTAPSRLFDVRFLSDFSALATTSVDPYLHIVNTGFRKDLDHEPRNMFLCMAPDGDRFLTFGSPKNIEIWSSTPYRIIGTIDAQSAQVVQAEFLSSSDIIYANTRGEIVHWSEFNKSLTLASLEGPISNFILLSANSIITEMHDGTLWLLDFDGRKTRIPQQHTRERIFQLSHDHHWLVTGNDNGNVTIYDTHNWHVMLNFARVGPVQHVFLSPTNNTLAVAMKSGDLYLANHLLRDRDVSWSSITWNRLHASPRFIAYTPTGDLMFVTNGDGAIWSLSTRDDKWLYFPSGTAGLTVLRVSPDGKHAATVDSIGRLMSIDLDSIRNMLSITRTTEHIP